MTSTDRDTGAKALPTSPPVRKKMAWWDRVRFLVLAAALFGFFVWSDVASNPILPVVEALERQLEAKLWLLVLAVLEIVRQLHYLASERSSAWHGLWSGRLFGGLDRRTGGWNPWTRFRIGRVARWFVVVAVIDLILAAAFDVSPAVALVEAPARLFGYLPLVLQLAFGFFFVIVQFVGLFWFLSRGGVDVYMPDDIETRFSDVWGQDAVLDKVQENIVYLEDPESIESKGGYVPGGILLWGPPGTGKTLIAEAVAGETGRPFVFVDPGAFINMFMGVGILKVKGLYRKLRKLALRYGGVIVFFDEADALGSRGQLAGGFQQATPPAWASAGCNGLGYLSPQCQAQVGIAGARGVFAPTVDPFMMGGMGGGGGGMGTLQALLTEMSGLKKPRGFVNRYVRRLLGLKPKPPPKYRILHIMATNQPNALDEAMLRPGRIDRIYKVGYPSKEGRKRTYVGYLAKVSHELTDAQVDRLATITPYATGASVKDIVNEALVMAVRHGRGVITWPDIIRAKQFKEHGVPDDAEYVERERHATAVHEACHAVAAYRQRRHATIDLATIERRGDIGGFVSSIPEEDLMFQWKSEYEVDIMTSIASLVGERMFFYGENSAGVGGDLRNATTVSLRMHAVMGMGDTLTSHTVTLARNAQPVETGEDRNLLETELGRRVEAHLAELYLRTEHLLGDNRREVLSVAHALEAHKTMSGEDVEAIIEGRVGPFVDGRTYRNPDFIRQVEAYHERAAAAHQHHLRDDLALPVLTMPPPEPEPVGAMNAEPPPQGS